MFTLEETFGKRRLQESGNKAAQNETLPETSRQIQVKGYRIEEKTDAKKNELSSSGLKWTILAAVFLAITLFGAGCMKKKR